MWAYVGLNSFGGPAGQIAVMHRVLVERRRWIGDDRFLHALNYCMLLPGPEAQQLATYIGWLLHGVRGALAAGLLFILPGFVTILALSIAYAAFQDTSVLQALFYGVKPAVVAVIAAAVMRLGRRTLTSRTAVALAACSFLAVLLLDLPFPIIVVVAATIGYLGGRRARSGDSPRSARSTEATEAARTPTFTVDHLRRGARPSARRTLAILAGGLTLWLAPIAALAVLLGPRNVYVQEGLFFSSAAVVTFGGAYAVLAYVAQQAVSVYGWLAPGEMLDGLGLAEATPGPLILVVEFVGFLAAYRQPGTLDPLVAGTLGAVLVTWVTFVPSFLWILVGAPYVEQLRANSRLSSALSAITAAVVGVVLYLGVWFSVQTFFGETTDLRAGPFRVHLADPTSLDLGAVAIALLAAFALFRLRLPVVATLAAAAAAGVALRLVALPGAT